MLCYVNIICNATVNKLDTGCRFIEKGSTSEKPTKSSYLIRTNMGRGILMATD